MLRYYNDISEERMEEKKEQLHKDHRSRLRKRYEENGLDSFEDHNVLELLLFYAIPRRDTNPAAHRLISKFGSLSGVFSASVEELQSGRDWEIERRISRACPRNGQTLYARCAFRTTVYRKGKNRRISCSLVFGKAAADLMPSCA